MMSFVFLILGLATVIQAYAIVNKESKNKKL